MSGPRILAIDLALEKTGLAYLSDDEDKPYVWTFNAGTKPGHARDAAIVAEIQRAVTVCRPQVVLIEDLYIPPRVGAGFLGLAFLHGVVRYYLSTVAPWAAINNSHIKIYAVGKGKGTDKQSIMLAVERRYNHLVTITDDNQADAFMLLALARHHYGHPLFTNDGKAVPDTHQRALTMIKTWPTLAS